MAHRWKIIILLIPFFVAGCGDSKVITNPGEAQKLDGNKVQVIEFWHTYDDKESRILESEMIPSFERQFPDIKIIPVRQLYTNGLKNVLIARASSNRGPDVIRMKKDWVPSFYQNNLLFPLGEFPDFRQVRHSLTREAIPAGLHQNQSYSLPMDMYVQVAIFNRELLKRAGYSEPPRTMEEILELARQKRYIIGLGGLNTWRTLPFIYSLGGTFADATFSKTIGYLNGKATVRAVEMLRLLYKEKLTDPSLGEEGGDNYFQWEGVKSGNVLITDEGPWFYTNWTVTEMQRTIKLTIPVPFPHDKGPSSLVDGEDLVITKGSKHLEASWTFLKWMTGKEAQLMISKSGLFPTNREADKSIKVSQDSYIHPYQEALFYAVKRPAIRNWEKIDEVYTLYMRKIFLDEISAKDGLTRAAEEIDRLLADAANHD